MHAGPEPETWIFDPKAAAGTANWTFVANSTLDTQYRSYGSVVLLPLLPQTNYQPVVMTMGGMGDNAVGDEHDGIDGHVADEPDVGSGSGDVVAARGNERGAFAERAKF